MKECVARTASNLRSWGKQIFGNFYKEMRDCRKHMEELMSAEPTEDTVKAIRALDMRMDELEEREECYWRQRSRQNFKVVIRIPNYFMLRSIRGFRGIILCPFLMKLGISLRRRIKLQKYLFEW